jgi:hypothetical protein
MTAKFGSPVGCCTAAFRTASTRIIGGILVCLGGAAAAYGSSDSGSDSAMAVNWMSSRKYRYTEDEDDMHGDGIGVCIYNIYVYSVSHCMTDAR